MALFEDDTLLALALNAAFSSSFDFPGPGTVGEVADSQQPSAPTPNTDDALDTAPTTATSSSMPPIVATVADAVDTAPLRCTHATNGTDSPLVAEEQQKQQEEEHAAALSNSIATAERRPCGAPRTACVGCQDDHHDCEFVTYEDSPDTRCERCAWTGTCVMCSTQ